MCYNLIYKNKNKEKETVAMRYIEERCFDMKENKRTISVDLTSFLVKIVKMKHCFYIRKDSMQTTKNISVIL